MHRGDQSFYRGSDRIIGGVASGLAAGLGIDPLWVRIAFVLLAFIQGIGLFIYIVLWLVMPERVEGAGPRSGLESMSDDMKRVGRELQAQVDALTGTRASGGSTDSSTATSPPPPPTGAVGPRSNQSILIGVIFVVVGGGLLAANTGLLTWTIVWPAAVILVGVVLFIRSLERRT